jgi:hypothetical protein
MPKDVHSNTNSDAENRLTELLARSHNDPDLFNACILARAPFCDYQRQWCKDLVTYRCLSIETGNQTGKDYWIGGIVPWWLWTRKDSLVIVTGPGQSLLGSVTWKEIRRAIERAPIPMGGRVSTGIKTSPHTVTLAHGWQALGFSTTSVERASGQHAGQLLVIVEEASGVPAESWDAIESLGYAKLVAIGNPLRSEGGFVDLCNQALSDQVRGVPKAEATCYRNLPSTASPHAHLDRSPVGLADRTWLEAVERKYGADSLWYRAHVLAVRPTLANEQLIPEADLDRCVNAESLRVAETIREAGRGGKRRIGCDVGEGCGNARTVVAVRDDVGIRELHASRYTGPGAAAEIIVKLAARHNVAESEISYDGAGQTGKRLGNALARRGAARARPYFGSSSGGKRCTNLRTACALSLARRLDPEHYPGVGISWHPFAIQPGADWPAIREELHALRYHLEGDQSALESKEDLMDRLGRSPDFADAITQTFREEAVAG